MKRVIIIGCGFAGLNAVKYLRNNETLEFIIFDSNNYHLFQPLLYQVAMAGLDPADIASPLRTIFKGRKNIKIYLGNIIDIKKDENTVISDFGEFYYDYLVIATGSTTHYFGNNHWKDFSYPLKTLIDARNIRNKILTSFEEAEKTTNVDIKKKYLTFVIIGGGPTGVELAGSLAEMCKFTMTKDFRNINTKDARIILLEKAPTIMGAYHKNLSKKANIFLEKMGIEVKTDINVLNIQDEIVKTDKGDIAASTIIWTAGIKPTELGEKAHLQTNKKGQIIVEQDLSIKNYPNIFAAGDIAYVEQKGKPLPGIAAVAMEEGIYIAKAIMARLNNKQCKPFKYINRGQMATIGRNKAIAEMGNLRLSGFSAWISWIFIHIYYLTGFKNKIVVMFQWAWSYFTYRKGSRIILR
jgi:NADH dehydrogenase